MHTYIARCKMCYFSNNENGIESKLEIVHFVFYCRVIIFLEAAKMWTVERRKNVSLCSVFLLFTTEKTKSILRTIFPSRCTFHSCLDEHMVGKTVVLCCLCWNDYMHFQLVFKDSTSSAGTIGAWGWEPKTGNIEM